MIKREVQELTCTSFFHFIPFGSRTREVGIKNDFDVKIIFHLSVFDTPKHVHELKAFRGTLKNPDVSFRDLVGHWLRKKTEPIHTSFLNYQDEYDNPVKIDLVIELMD